MASGMCTRNYCHSKSNVACPEVFQNCRAIIYRRSNQHPQHLVKVKLWSNTRIIGIRLWMESYIKCCQSKCRGSHLISDRTKIVAASNPHIHIWNSEVKEVELPAGVIWNIVKHWRQVQVMTIIGLLAYSFVAIPSAGAVDALKTCACLLKECRFLMETMTEIGNSIRVKKKLAHKLPREERTPYDSSDQDDNDERDIHEDPQSQVDNTPANVHVETIGEVNAATEEVQTDVVDDGVPRVNVSGNEHVEEADKGYEGEEEADDAEFTTRDPLHEVDEEFLHSGYSNIPVSDIESEYAPSEGIRSVCSDSEDSDAGGDYCTRYMSMKDINQVPALDIGVSFADAREFRWAVNQNAIYDGFDYDILRNDSDRITLQCKNCSWRIHASLDKFKEYFQIKTLQGEHSCERVTTNTRATATWLGKKYVDYWRRDPGMKLITLSTKILKELQLEVTHDVLVNARRESMRLISGLVRDQYHRLHDYAGILLERHPGSLIKLKTHRPTPEGPLHFQRFYIGFAELVRGFWQGCRPFIGLDGCHLRNGKSSILLSAVSRDANDQMYPISYAIVEGESRETWTWFMENLLESLGEVNTRVTFISDRQKGLVETLRTLTPNHEHRYCVRHIYSNMLKLNTGLRQGVLKEHLWSCASAPTPAIFYSRLDKLKVCSEVAFQYLNQLPYPLWTRSAFSFNSSCDLLSNNVSECFNHWILKARELPMLNLVDTVRKQIMSRLEAKKENDKKWTTQICPRIVDKIAKLKRRAMNYGRAQYAGNDLFEVVYQNSENDIEQYVVDLNERTCNCRMWQLSGIPCVHGICAINNRRKDVLSFVSPWYNKEMYMKCYAGHLQPIPGPMEWPRRNYEPMEPPIWKAMPGRPKKTRRKGIDEVQHGGRKSGLRSNERQRCTKCHGYGHNRRKCQLQPGEGQTLPGMSIPIVNKGGRPPSHGRYCGRKRKIAATESSGSGRGVTNETGRGVANETGRGVANETGRGRGRGTFNSLGSPTAAAPSTSATPTAAAPSTTMTGRRSNRAQRRGGAAAWFVRRPWKP